MDTFFTICPFHRILKRVAFVWLMHIRFLRIHLGSFRVQYRQFVKETITVLFAYRVFCFAQMYVWLDEITDKFQKVISFKSR